jgi:tetratricopeptide (TPR) repeat protein
MALAFIATCLSCSAAATVTDPIETFSKATETLDGGKLAEAITFYETLIASDWHSPELYHNLGVAYQRDGKEELALLQLYRAWLLNPFSDAARSNFLSVANDAHLSSQRLKHMESQASALAWRQPLAICGLIAFWLGILTFILLRQPVLRGLGIAAIAIGILVSGAAYYFHCQIPSADAAWVITGEAVPLRASHGKGAPRMSSLTPLTQVEMTAHHEEWDYVKSLSGSSGWVDASKLGKLMPWRS